MPEDDNSTGVAAEPGAAELSGLLQGMWKARAVQVAAELKLADLLVDGPKTIEQLAAATGSHPPSLRRLLRALVGIGVFAELDAGELVQNSPTSEWLRTDRDGSMAAKARFQGARWSWAAWGALPHSVRTGEIAFDRANELSFWELTGTDPEAAELFNDAMAGASQTENADIAKEVDVTGVRTVVDVGGGLGGLLAAVLAANPATTGTLLERPAAAEKARNWLSGQHINGRFDVVSGDFFQAVPAGAELYLIKRTLHDWNDADAIRILATVRAAMKPESRIVLVEYVSAPESTAIARFVDLLPLVMVPGFDRTSARYAELLTAAGFSITRELNPADAPICLFEARMAG